jgi:type II secretory pathway component PulM
MRQWFYTLQPRERIMVSVGAVAAALIIFWGFVWTPLVGGTEELRTSVADKSRLLAAVYRADAAPGATGPVVARGTSSLVVLIDRTAQANGLADSVTRSRPDGADSISVSFQNASFDRLTDWLVALEQNEGVTVDSASISGTREPGRVSGQVFLSRN